MGFNLHFAEPEHRRPHKRGAHSSRKLRLLPALALCLAASLMGDLLLASGRYSSLLVNDAGAKVIAGRHALQVLVYGR